MSYTRLSRLFAFIVLFGLALVRPEPVSAQVGRDYIKFAPIAPVSAAAGESATILVNATISKHWHTYGLKPVLGPDGFGPFPTVVSIEKSKVIKLSGKVTSSKGKVHYDSTWEASIEEFYGRVQFTLPIKLDATLKKGKYRAEIKVEFQMCDTTSCIAPDDVVLPVEIIVTAEASASALEEQAKTQVAGSGTSDTSNVVGGPETSTSAAGLSSSTTAITVDSKSEIESEQQKGLWSFFLYAMGVGFLALLTPCVFPMIPITVSFFTKRNEKHRSRALIDALLFAIGIISTFTLIGIAASMLFGETALQDLSASGWMNIAIGILFLALAFNLFGAFEIQVPISILNKLNKKAQGNGVMAVFLMGFTFSLTSFTCTAPFVSTALTLASKDGISLAPTVGMLGFSTAFALPFFFLALFPSLLVALPKAGGWMNNMKVVMGFLEIAAAVKFISTAEFVWNWGILPREPFLAIWSAVCLLISLYILGVFHMKLDSPVERVSGLRAMFAVMFATMAIWFMAGMLGKPLPADLEALLPPDNYHQIIDGTVGASILPTTTSGTKVDEHAAWFSNLDQAKKIARETNRPVFIDFTGFACVNCRWMEKFMFPKESIKSRFEKMVLVQLYTDRKQEPYITNQEIMRGFGPVANPLYVILNPDGSYVAQSGYTRDESKFLEFLDQAF